MKLKVIIAQAIDILKNTNKPHTNKTPQKREQKEGEKRNRNRTHKKVYKKHRTQIASNIIRNQNLKVPCKEKRILEREGEEYGMN